MKVVMYGTKACPDCVEAEEILKEKGIQYLYMEFSDNIGYLKRFLTLRDTNPIFDEVKENHWVGVPCFQFQDGSLSLDIDEVVRKKLKSSRTADYFVLCTDIINFRYEKSVPGDSTLLQNVSMSISM